MKAEFRDWQHALSTLGFALVAIVVSWIAWWRHWPITITAYIGYGVALVAFLRADSHNREIRRLRDRLRELEENVK